MHSALFMVCGIAELVDYLSGDMIVPFTLPPPNETNSYVNMNWGLILHRI